MGKIERKCHTSLHSFRISFKRHWGSSNRFSKRHVLKHLERHFVRPLWGCLLIRSLPNIGYVHTVSAYNEQFVLHTTRFIQHISTKFGIYQKKSWIATPRSAPGKEMQIYMLNIILCLSSSLFFFSWRCYCLSLSGSSSSSLSLLLSPGEIDFCCICHCEPFFYLTKSGLGKSIFFHTV